MARTILTDAERLAWERFPADPDREVVGAYFTLADGEVDALRRLPTLATRLASAVALSATGTLGCEATRARARRPRRTSDLTTLQRPLIDLIEFVDPGHTRLPGTAGRKLLTPDRIDPARALP